jgi:hypothetical protein
MLTEYLDSLLAVTDPQNRQNYHRDFTKIASFRWLRDFPDWNALDAQYQAHLSAFKTDFPDAPPPLANAARLDPAGRRPPETTPMDFLDAASGLSSPEEYRTFYRQRFSFFTGTVKPVSPEKIALFQELQALPLTVADNNPGNWSNLFALANRNGIVPNNLIPNPDDVAQHGTGIIREFRDRFAEQLTESYHEKELLQTSRPSPGPRAADGSLTKELFENFVKNPFKRGTAVPDFAVTRNGALEIMRGYSFAGTDPMGHTVYLEKPGDGGRLRTITVSNTLYRSLIGDAALPAGAPELTPEIIRKYEQLANIDTDKVRSNTAANFWHNYRVLSREHAQNPVTAMKVARDIYNRMRPEEQNKFRSSVLLYEQTKGESYNDRILRYYHESVKDIPIKNRTPFHESSLVSSRLRNDDVVNVTGKPVDDKLRVKIGDEVKLALTIPDLLTGRSHKSVTSGLILTSASAELNKVVLMDKDGLSKYVLSRNDFIKRMEKVEKRRARQERAAEMKQRRVERKEAIGFGY